MDPDAPCSLAEPPVEETSWLAAQPAAVSLAPDTSPLDHQPDRFPSRWLTATRPQDFRWGFYLLAVFLGTVIVLLNGRGPCLQTNWGHDAIGFLNGAWKVRCGVLPHTDYTSALGALNPWILAAGMWVLGPTAAVLPFCISLVAAAIGFLAFVVARPRLPAWLAVVFACTQTVVAAAPHLLRFAWYTATYDGYYNRQGYALVSVLLLVLFLPPRADHARHERWDGRLVGGLLGVMLFLKVSYFMAGGALCALAFVFAGRSSRAWLANMATAFLVTTVLCLSLIHFDVLALWRDLHLAAEVRMGNPDEAFRLGRYLGWLPDAWLEIGLLAAMSLLLAPPFLFRRRLGGNPSGLPSLASFAFFRGKNRPPVLWDTVPSWMEFIGVVAVGAFVCMTNASVGDFSETPLLTSWLFVLLGSALQNPSVEALPPDAGSWTQRRLPALGALAGLLWIFTYGASGCSLGWSVSPWTTRWQQTALTFSPPIQADSLQDLRMMFWAGEDYEVPVPYAEKINDGLRMLRSIGGTHRVEALDFVNPFPFALQWPAARGGAWCWHDGFSFSAAHHPPPEKAFGDADVVMLSKYPGNKESFRTMMRVYGPYVRAHFQPVIESAQWVLLRRASRG